MLAITGIARAKTGYSIPEYGHNIALYPKGRHLRGAAGYSCMELNLPVQKIFPDWDTEAALFFDMIPYCKCGKLMVSEACPDCGLNLKDFVRQVRTRNLSYREFVEGLTYRIKIIVMDENYFDDLFNAMKHLQAMGLRIGGRKNSGYGLFEILELHAEKVSPINAREVRLLSDAVIDGLGSKTISIGKTIETDGGKFETYTLRVVPKGQSIKIDSSVPFNGFAVGKLTSLGFGEVTV